MDDAALAAVAPTSVNAAAPTAVRPASSLETCLIL
jgi:hypothetical protein